MSRRRNPNLKSAFKEETYTEEQFQEIIRCTTDPKYFIKNYVYIKHPVKGRIKFDLYDYQEDMVHLYHTSDLAIVLSARQTGKTESICAYLLWYAIFHEEVTILIASNKSSGAMELIAKIQDVYEYLPHWLKPGINEDSWNKHECKFDNKSRIVSTTTSKDSGRGLAISLLYCDEFAFVPANIQEEFWTSIQPTLSCLRGDTLVYTNDGLIPIEELHTNRKVGDYFELKDVNTWGRGGNEKVSHGYVSPEGTTRVITNSWGMEVEATLNHPFFVAGEEVPHMKPTKELTDKDYIRIDYGMEMFGKQQLDADLAYMLGGYIAEGWAWNRNGYKFGLSISNTDDDFRNVYLNSTEVKPFTIDPSRPEKLHCYSTQLVERYEQLGVNLDAKCNDKTTPISIMRGTKSTVCNYLAGLFDGDGSVTDRSINLTSTSKRLIQETQLLLLNLGIVSKVYYVSGESKSARIIANNKNVTTSYKDAWSLNIPLSQYKKFNSVINLRIKRKKEKLLQISKKRKQDDYKQFSIPASIVRNTITNIIEQANISGYTLRKKHGIRIDKVLDHSKSDRSITVQWFKRFSDLIKKESPSTWERYENFFTEYSEKCSWVKISKIEESYQKITYDFTVPKSHSFLQSGFMGSNTGGRCIISSTPNGNSNKFAQLWRGSRNKTNQFRSMHIPWDAPPGRDEAFKRKQIGLLGKRKWLQEYECCHGNTLVEICNEEESLYVKVPIDMLYYYLETDLDIFDLNPDGLTEKYVISPLNHETYCRKNGHFLRHIKSYGYKSYQDFFESLYPKHIKKCKCGNTASFINSKMAYYEGCGNITCRNKNISKAKSEITPEQWSEIATKYKNTMSQKPEQELLEIVTRRTANGHSRGSYKKSPKKRQKTCEKRYGNKYYNNPKKISETKLNWSDAEKKSFLIKLKKSLGDKWLNDFMSEETFAKRRKKLEAMGKVVPEEDLDAWTRYRNRVRNLTAKNYRKYKKEINPQDLPRGIGKDKYHLDHIIPVFFGFMNGINEEDIASVTNLQMLSDHENRSKSFKYDSEGANTDDP